MRAAVLPVIWLFDITHLRRVLYKKHTSRTFTAFYRIHEPEKEVHVLAVMTIGQARKRYGWL